MRNWAAGSLSVLITLAGASAAPPQRAAGSDAGVQTATLQYRVRVVGGQMTGQLFPQAINQAGTLTGHVGDHPREGFVAPRPGAVEVIAPGVFTGSETTEISDSGYVAGVGYQVRGHTSDWAPFRIAPDGTFLLLRPLENSSGLVVAVNDSGDVAGQWDDRVGSSWAYHRAFVYTDQDGFQLIPTLGGPGQSVADINNAGQVAGMSINADWGFHAFLWDDQGLVDLGTLGGERSHPNALNDAGVVVGAAQDAADVFQAFRYTADSGLVAIPMPPEVVSSEAFFINEHGQTAGVAQLASGAQIFLHTSGGGTELLPLPAGQHAVVLNDFNNRGELVGQSSEGFYGGQEKSLFYSPQTGLVEIQELLEDASGIRSMTLSSLNDAGMIGGRIQLADFSEIAVRLVPVGGLRPATILAR